MVFWKQTIKRAATSAVSTATSILLVSGMMPGAAFPLAGAAGAGAALETAGVAGALGTLGATVALSGAISSTLPETAYAETYAVVVPNGATPTEIEQLTSTYEGIRAQVEEVDAKIAELQARIDEIEAILPEQQARGDEAARQLYKVQHNPVEVTEVLLQSATFDDFLRGIDYFDRISRASVKELVKTREMRAELQEAYDEQDRIKAEVDARLEEASAALAAEQDRRAARARSGIATSIAQAGAQGGEASVGVAYDGGEQPEDYREAATADTSALSDGANWYSTRDEFIAEWAPRIDRYLAGSPLEGQGVNFASSAWRYGMDPRWSPAISNTESSKGRYCIRPHNAWGWGAADVDPYGLALEWNSWEEAIDAHVKGLSEGYGYTIAMNLAKRYCPNTWQSWYNRTLGQMALI